MIIYRSKKSFVIYSFFDCILIRWIANSKVPFHTSFLPSDRVIGHGFFRPPVLDLAVRLKRLFRFVRRLEKTHLFGFWLRCAVGDRPRQAIHLPEIPRNYVNHSVQKFLFCTATETRFVILGKRHQNIDAAEQQVIALKFKAVRALQRAQRPAQPFVIVGSVFVHYAQLAVKKADAFFDWDDLARGSVVA